ncbi:MAG TPA: fibronectin type III domain-containing protein [Ignavibacteriales bacterium]|nr:fibronectin type III domain-containing protein [Ignavibacteriales bacterium]
MKNIYLHITGLIFLAFMLGGCADSTNSPDKLAPTLEVYKPGVNDTVTVGKQAISYAASDDQRIAYFELYVNGKFVSHVDPNSDGTNPVIYWNVDSTLTNTKVSYYIVAYDDGGNSTKSKEITGVFISESHEPPSAPSNLSLRKFENSNTVFNLAWTDNSNNEDGFELWRKDGQDGQFHIVYTAIPRNNTTANDQVPSESVTYYYKVRAYRDTIKSEFSNIIGTTGSNSLIPHPVNLTASASKTGVKIDWVFPAAAESILGFEIERKGWGDYSQLAILLPSISHYEDTKQMNAYQIYTYRIRAFTGEGKSDWSDEISVTIPKE